MKYPTIKNRGRLDKYVTKQLGFKKKTFSDGSEYWFEKSFKFPVFGRLKATIDTERGIITLEVKSNLNIFNNYGYDEFAMVDYWFKNEKDINRILRRITHN